MSFGSVLELCLVRTKYSVDSHNCSCDFRRTASLWRDLKETYSLNFVMDFQRKLIIHFLSICNRLDTNAHEMLMVF